MRPTATTMQESSRCGYWLLNVLFLFAWTDALSGRVAGLNLVWSNSVPAGQNKIIFRGENNLTGDNEALVVVNDVVINQGSGHRSASNGEASYSTGSDNMPVDYGSGLNDSNPENI
jgi:hypothetical protein